MFIKLDKTLQTLCTKVDSEPSHTFKIMLIAKRESSFKFAYFCKNPHTRGMVEWVVVEKQKIVDKWVIATKW